MPSILARLKAKAKHGSHQEDEDEHNHPVAGRVSTSRESVEIPDRTSSIANAEHNSRPPQIPALDFSEDAASRSDEPTMATSANKALPPAPVSGRTLPSTYSKGPSASYLPDRSAILPLRSTPWTDGVSIRNPDVSSTDYLSQAMSSLSLQPSSNLGRYESRDTPALVAQRKEMVDRIASEIRLRRRGRAITTEGKKVFQAAGMEALLAAQDTVEVHTRWLPPVIQEHIIPREHTEYFVLINREIHKYHIYPKIQPVSDPEPILLEPRHRIFDAVTGHWHEVIGDAAAIAILGEDVFRNGPKEVRSTRAMALPGFGPMAQLTVEERQRYGLGQVDESGVWIDDGATAERTTLSMVVV